LILIGLGYLFGVIASFGVSGSAGIVFLLIVGPLVALLMTIYVRVTLELVMVFFKIYENTREMVRLNAVSGASQPYVPPLGGPAAATGPMPFQGPTT